MTLPLTIKAFVVGAASYVVTRWVASQRRLRYVMQADAPRPSAAPSARQPTISD